MKTILLFLMLAVSAAGPAAAQSPDAFEAGDVILLRVEGDSVLSDTFAVEPGPLLRLPDIGEVPLKGVARSEVQDYLGKYLGRYLRNPMVHARSLVRLSIVGEVTEPGFYAMRGDIPVTDAIMVAGGLTRESNMEEVKVERGNKTLLEGKRLREQIAQGRTLDQMGLRAGDRVVVPRRGRDFESTVRIIGILVTVPLTLYATSRIVDF